MRRMDWGMRFYSTNMGSDTPQHRAGVCTDLAPAVVAGKPPFAVRCLGECEVDVGGDGVDAVGVHRIQLNIFRVGGARRQRLARPQHAVLHGDGGQARLQGRTCRHEGRRQQRRYFRCQQSLQHVVQSWYTSQGDSEQRRQRRRQQN